MNEPDEGQLPEAPPSAGGGMTRRSFVRAFPASALCFVVPARASGMALGSVVPSDARPRIVHPDPRPGIDASGVLGPDAIGAFGPQVVEVYDMVREMPHIADGIGCSCGCAALPNYRSLLTCFHATGMAMGCMICQGQARLAHGRFKEGQDLERIRRAIDARFG